MMTPRNKIFQLHYVAAISLGSGGGFVYFDPSYGVFKYDIDTYTQDAIDAWCTASRGWFIDNTINLSFIFF